MMVATLAEIQTQLPGTTAADQPLLTELHVAAESYVAAFLNWTETTVPNPVPAAVRRAVAELVGQWFRQIRTAQSLGYQNIGSRPDPTRDSPAAVATVYPWAQSSGYPLPPAVRALLLPFRQPML